MSSRLPQIHPSALSPQEYEAYAEVIGVFTQRFQVSSSISDPTQVWDYLVPWIESRAEIENREKEFLAFFRNLPSSSIDPSHTLLALLRLAAHSQKNSLLTRDHLFIQSEPLALSKPSSLHLPIPTNNNPFLSDKWANRRTSLLTPPSSLPSPTSPLSPSSSDPTPKTRAQKSTPTSEAFALASPPPSSATAPTGQQLPETVLPPEVPPRRPNLPPPRRSSNTATPRSVSASSTTTPNTPSSASTILAPSSAPPLPLRRSVSLNHSQPVPPPSPQLSRASTIKLSRPPPPLPPSKLTKPSPRSTTTDPQGTTSRSSISNAHIGLEDSLVHLRRSSSSHSTLDPDLPTLPGGNRSRKSSLSLVMATGGGKGNRSRSNSTASSIAVPSVPDYTYSPIASSSSSSSISAITTTPNKTRLVETSNRFEGFSNGSIVLPPSASSLKPNNYFAHKESPPPPSHPNRRKASTTHATTLTSSSTTSPLSSSKQSRKSPFNNNNPSSADPFSNTISSSPLSTKSTVGEGFMKVREVIESIGGGGGNSRSRKKGKSRMVDHGEEGDGLMGNEDDDIDVEDGGAEEGEGNLDELEEERGTTSSSSSETEDDERRRGGINVEKRERRTEVEREARRRDEFGQWVQLA